MPKLVTLMIVVALLAAGAVGVTAQEESSYTVQYGDVLDLIAASMDMSAACIAEQSGLDNPNDMRPGDTLIFSPACPPYDGLIPIERAVDDEDADQGGGATAQSASSGEYIVKRGDVLDLIAARYNVSVSCLAEANELASPGMIYVGDEIDVDVDCPPYDGVAFATSTSVDAEAQGQGGGGRTYTVRVGDVLDLIGAQFNLSASCLAESNNLENPGRIFPGDEITIDPGCPPYDGLALALQQ